MDEFLNPPVAQLVREIDAVNHAWKVAAEFGDIPQLADSLKEMKSRLQARLLRQYAPTQVYLELGEKTDSSEPLYDLRLREPVGGRTDAAHLPVRVANEILSPEEIERFKKSVI